MASHDSKPAAGGNAAQTAAPTVRPVSHAVNLPTLDENPAEMPAPAADSPAATATNREPADPAAGDATPSAAAMEQPALPEPVAIPSETEDNDVSAAQPAPAAAPTPAVRDADQLPAETLSSLPELTLDDVIRATLNANPDLVTASEQIGRAEAILERARREFYPTLGVSESYGVSNNPVQAFMFMLNQTQLDPTLDFNHPGTRDDFHTELMYRHRIYAGGRRQHEYCAAAASRRSSIYNLAAVQNQLVFTAAEAYYRLVQADVLVAVRAEAVKQVEQHLKIVESRYRNQTAVKSDVLTVEVRLAEVQEALISARNQLELAWSVLENVTGTAIPRRGLPDDVLAAPWEADVDRIEDAIAEAQSLRPEIGMLAGQREAAAERACAAETGKKATADMFASYDVYTGDFDRGNDSYFVGLVLNLNLFDAGRTKMDVAEAMARVRELRAKERRLMLDIELDVRKSHLELADARQRLEVTIQAIDQAKQSLVEIEARYRGQAATISELVDSQVALSNARVRRANAEAQVEIARASLQRAVGRLVDTMGS
jgi:outer membrane protein